MSSALRGAPVLVVAAALVRDGRVLAGLRRDGGWEFPGGKVEPDESLPEALVRECREELGVPVEPVRELGAVRRGGLDLRLWLAELAGGSPAAVDHVELRWVAGPELDAVDWLPADRELLGAVRPLLG